MKIGKVKLSKVTLALLAAALLLFASGGVMATRAVLTINSNEHVLQLSLDDLDTVLLENGNATAQNDRVLLKDLENTDIAPGKVYDEALAVKNNASYDQYVRLVVRKYWKNEEGQKVIDLSPELIQFVFNDAVGYNTSDWKLNDAETTDERTVYYYKKVLSGGDTTSALTEGVRIDPSIADDVVVSEREEDGQTIYTYEYTYDGYHFGLEAEAQAVQTHHAEDAIKSVWGVDPSATGINIE